MDVSQNQTEYDEFLRRRNILSNLLQRQLTILSSLRLTSLEANFQKLYQDVLADNFKVLVIGEFKRGKSTFINALLGQKILPAYATPTTAIICEVKWGEEQKAFLYPLVRKNGGTRRILEISPDDLEQYIVINSEYTKSYENPYEKVELLWPLDICRNGIEIIDSPGLNEDMGRQIITLDYLSSVDAVIFVISCDSPISMSERSSIDTIIQAGHKRIFFICNRIDIIDEDQQDRIKNFLRNNLRPFTDFGDRYIFFISARDALRGRERQNAEKVRESGLLEVEAALKTFLATERGRVKIGLPALALRQAIDDVWQDLPNRQKMLHIDISTLQARQIQAERELKIFETERYQIIDILREFRLKTISYVDGAATTFYRNLSGKIPGWAQDYQVQQPIKSLEILSGKSRTEAQERVTEEITKFLTHKVSAAYQEWQSSELVPELEIRIERLRQELEDRLLHFESGLEQIRLDLEANSNFSAPIYRRNEISPPSYNQLLTMSNSLATNKVNTAGFGTVFSFKNVLMSFSPSAIVSPLILFFGWNPLTFIPAAAIAGTILVSRGGSTFTKKIKEAICEQYETRFKESIDDLASAVAKHVDSGLREIENNLDQRLSLKIQNIRDQVNAVLIEKEQGRARVDQATEELDAIQKQLIDIEIEVNELLRISIKDI